MPEVRVDVYANTHGAPAELKKTDAALDGVGRSGDSAHRKLGGLWKQIAGGILTAEAAKKVLGFVNDVIGGSVESAKEAESAHAELAAALDITRRTTSALLPHFVKFSEELQQATIYEDDAIQSSMALMLQLTNLDRQGIEKAMKGAAGLATVFKIDLQSATMMVAKAMEGNFDALGRYGIKVDKTLPLEERRKQLLEILLGLYKRSEAEVNTFAGAEAQLKNNLDNVKETIGDSIIKNEALQNAVKGLSQWVSKIASSDDFKLWLNTTIELTVKAAQLVGKFAGEIIKLTEWLTRQKKHDRELAESQSLLNDTIREAAERGIPSAVRAWERIQAQMAGAKTEIKTTNDSINETGNVVTETGEVTDKYKQKVDQLLDSLGMNAEKNKELIDTDRILHDLYDSGKISLEKFNRAHKELVDKMFEYGEVVPTPITKTRDLAGVLDQARGSVDALSYGIETDEDRLKFFASQLGIATNELLAFYYESQRLALFLQTGIMLPDLNFGVYVPEAQQATSDISNAFDGLYNDIASGWGNTIQEYLDGGLTLENFIDQLCENTKSSFFRMIGEMTADKVLGFFQNLFSKVGNAATGTMASTAQSAVGAVTNITKGASSAIGGMWTGLGAAVGSFLGTALAGLIGGGPSGHQQQQQINDIKDMRNFLADISHAMEWVNKSLDTLKDIGWKMQKPLDTAVRLLDKIAQHTSALKNLKSAQGGFEGRTLGPTLFLTHAGEDVKITPAAARIQAGGASRVEAHVHIKPILIKRDDGYLIEFVQEKIEYVKKQYDLGNWKIPITSVRGA